MTTGARGGQKFGGKGFYWGDLPRWMESANFQLVGGVSPIISSRKTNIYIFACIYIDIYHSASLCTDPPSKPEPSNFFSPTRYLKT